MDLTRTNELISVIVPVYNVARYLPECLESITNQSYHQLEIILVNDGSTDESGELCDRWSEKDPRIHVIHKNNGGVSSARNMGLEAAHGSYIGFVDSDDWVESELYERLHKAISGSDMACCGYYDYPMASLELSVTKGTRPSDPCGPVDAAFRIYERDGYFTSIWNKLYRREMLFQDGKILQMDTKIAWGEDEVWLAQVLGRCKRIAFVPLPLYYWRPTESSATRKLIVTDRQMTLFKAKQLAIELLPQDEGLQKLVRARMYNDCYSLKILAYLSKDWEKYEEVSSILNQIKKEWMQSPDSLLIRKIKVQLMEAEMKLHLPGKLLQMTNNVKRYGIKR